MYFISQAGKEDCAFTCLSIFLANFNKDKNYLFLKHEDRPYNFKEIICIAQKYNMNLLGIKIPNAQELMNCKTFPFITVVKPKGQSPHSVIVLKANKRKVIFYDPQLGKRTMDFFLFLDRWTKYALILKDFVKTKCDVKPISFIKKKDKIILPLVEILSGLFLLTGTYFLDKEKYFYLPIIFMSLFVIFEIIYRRSLVSAMRHIDENIYSRKIPKPKIGYCELFETIQKYKTASLTLSSSLVSSILIAIFIAMVLVANNYMNIIYLCLVLGISCFESFIFNPSFKSNEAIICEYENQVTNASLDYQFSFFAKRASESAHQLAYKKVLLRYVEIAILLIVSTVIMYLTGAANLAYIVFYLCINIFMIETFNKLFDCLSQKDQYDSLRSKVINYIK